MKLLIVGISGGTHIGGSLLHAAQSFSYDAELVDARLAYSGHWAWQKICWHLLGRRPSSPQNLKNKILSSIKQATPDLFISTGISPVGSDELRQVKILGGKTVNYLTDDPWNLGLQDRRFIATIPDYDIIFTPRRSLMDVLKSAGAKHIVYLPFGYDVRFFPGRNKSGVDEVEETRDVSFVGGADHDRRPFLSAIADAGLSVVAFGNYWDRYSIRGVDVRGNVPHELIAEQTRGARVILILVRRANRDGHVMRTFEAAACGGCLLVEDTAEHREIFGDTVTYFQGHDDVVVKAKKLLKDADLRRSLAEASTRRILHEGKHTYKDRLHTILAEVNRIRST